MFKATVIFKTTCLQKKKKKKPDVISYSLNNKRRHKGSGLKGHNL